jgi:hypothetical protein
VISRHEAISSAPLAARASKRPLRARPYQVVPGRTRSYQAVPGMKDELQATAANPSSAPAQVAAAKREVARFNVLIGNEGMDSHTRSEASSVADPATWRRHQRVLLHTQPHT